MKKHKLKTYSIINLILGYITTAAFILLISINLLERASLAQIDRTDTEIKVEEKNSTEVVFVDRFIDKEIRAPYYDHLEGVVVNTSEEKVVTHIGRPVERVEVEPFRQDGVYTNTGTTIIDKNLGEINFNENRIHNRNHIGRSNHRDDVVGGFRDLDNFDPGLLDRRLRETRSPSGHVENNEINRHIKPEFGKHVDGVDFSKMTIARDEDDAQLGGIDFNPKTSKKKGYGVAKGGELYAYNYPSKGVGAGIGAPAIGAGAGGGVGIGAAIGEGILNGEVVPTLGGIGTGAKPIEGQSANSTPSGGVGGLMGGAAAGGAAGLTQGYITEKLGMGSGIGQGGGYGSNKRGYNYDHLPKDGALHIMMHVDGSGSILNTRKQLEIMKDTLLKDSLLPYYNNNEELYNKRVTIISNSGERTLKFFNEAAKKDNVLAIAFQDEAQPSYHLPNFNKKPEDHYLDDLNKLKSSLNGYGGVYRGVMFQVDRGKTFAKSFKEFVGNAFKGEGYLKSDNLKKYYRENNNNYIKNKEGIVFSDEYHAKDSGDPSYYLNLIFEASKKIGLDLNLHKGGLTDGKYNKD